MVVTFDHELPTFEELTVEEVPISTPGLRAGAHHLGNFFYKSMSIILYFVRVVMFRKVLSGS